MKISRLAPAALCVAALPLLTSVARATNPCDVSEKACAEWKKAMEAEQGLRFDRSKEVPRYPARACDADPRYCAPAATPAPVQAAACPDGRELDGRPIMAAVTFLDTGKMVFVKLAPVACEVVHPRDEPPMPDFSRRDYESTDGTALSVYTGPDRPTSTISLRLADDASSATLIPAFNTAELASGRSIDLGEVLLVRLNKARTDGTVVRVKLSIRSVAP